MHTIKIKNFKHLLNTLATNHNVTLTMNLWCYGHPKQVIHVALNQVEHLFTNNMIHDWNEKPIEFTDVYGQTYTFNTDKQNRLRLLFIYHYQITGPEFDIKIRGFKQLMQHIERTHDVIVSFVVQKINNHWRNPKPVPDTFLHRKTTLRRIERQYDYDMFFNFSTDRDFTFKQLNDKRFRLQRHRIRSFETKHIMIYPKK